MIMTPQEDIDPVILLENQEVLQRYSQACASASARTISSTSTTQRASFSQFQQNDVTSKHICTKDIHSLREVDLRELNSNYASIAIGARIVLTVVVVPVFCGTHLSLLVRDAPGQLIELDLYNYFSLDMWTKSNCDFWFPIGSQITLKEPNMSADLRRKLRVDNMLNVLICRPFSTCTGLEFKDLGNESFKAGLHNEAHVLYTLALGLVTNTSSRTTLQCNKAAAALRIRDFRRAVSHCNESLILDNKHFKTSYRKAQALIGLRRYDEALSLLQVLLKSCEFDDETITRMPELQRTIMTVNAAMVQRAGDYDFKTLPFHPSNQLEVGCFLGPLVIKQSGASGRGLFLSKSVRKGDLLLVEQPMAFNFKSSKHNIMSDTSTTKDEDHYATMVELVNMACGSKQNNALLSILSSEKESIDFLPNINDVFSQSLSENTPPLSAHTINGICLINCFCLEVDAKPSSSAREAICRSVDMMQSKVVGLGSGQRKLEFQPQNLLMETILNPLATASDIARILDVTSLTEVSKADPSGFTALHYACIMQSELKCLLLLQAGASVGARDELGMTPMHFSASQFYNYRIVKELIEHGADVNAFSYRRLTPLFLAVEKQNKESIRQLLASGANPLLENDQFDSALSFAKRKQVLDVFQGHGGNSMKTDRIKMSACGLWLLASLFNHSTIPNSYSTHVGRLMFVRAAENMPVGTEITVAYMQDNSVLKKKWGIK